MTTQIKTTWQETTLGEVAEINPSESLDRGRIAKYVAMENIGPFTRQISKFAMKAYNGGMKFRNGDTLLARITPCLENGKTSYVDFLNRDEVGFGSTEFIVIREKEDLSDEKFLYYLAISPRFREIAIKSMTGTSGRQRVQTDLLANENQILLPPLPEQRAIAAVLSSLDDKIELLREQNKTLEATAQAIFKEWFAAPSEAFLSAEASAKAEAEEGELPKGWRVGKIKDLINIFSGFAFSSSDFFQTGKYKLVTIKNVQDRHFDQKIKDTLDDLPSKMPSYCNLKTGDILLSLTGNVGRICLVIGEDYLLNQRVAKLEPINAKDYAFSYLLFLQDSIFSILLNTASGTAQQNLSPIQTKEIEIAVPSRKILDGFGSIANPMLGKINFNNSQIQTLSKLRDALLPKLMSGQIRA